MKLDFVFFLNSFLFGIGLAMDAFSVSMADGLNEPEMKKTGMLRIAGTFCFFQFIMPLLGWFFVHTISELFVAVQKFIPVIALLLLLYIGGKMLLEGIRDKGTETEKTALGFSALLLQGIATSIDALSVGFTISEYSFGAAAIECVIIGLVTFVICMIGLMIGKKFGGRLAGKASVLGGVILIAIGIEIFAKGLMA